MSATPDRPGNSERPAIRVDRPPEQLIWHEIFFVAYASCHSMSSSLGTMPGTGAAATAMANGMLSTETSRLIPWAPLVQIAGLADSGPAVIGRRPGAPRSFSLRDSRQDFGWVPAGARFWKPGGTSTTRASSNLAWLWRSPRREGWAAGPRGATRRATVSREGHLREECCRRVQERHRRSPDGKARVRHRGTRPREVARLLITKRERS